MASLDWLIVAAFLIAIVVFAFRTSRPTTNVREYFLASRSLHTWLVVASVLATEVSAATVVGAPDTSFNNSIAYLQTTIGAVFSRFVLAYYFIEVYYRSGVVTVYGYLAQRFGPKTQRLSAWVFCLGRVAASASRLYIAALAISFVVGLSFSITIVVVGVIALVYSVIGGLRVVAITDVLQGSTFIFLGVIVLYLACADAGGLYQAMNDAAQGGKLTLFVFEWNIFSVDFWKNPYTFMGGLFGGLVLGLATHGTDQDMVQRVLASRSSKAARRSMIWVGLLEIPIALLFVLVGVSIWSYFTATGIEIPVGQSVLPFYVKQYLGVGARGLFVAAVLAAALSSLDSAINALASVAVTDLRFGEKSGEQSNIRGAFWASAFWGVMLIAVALLLGQYHQTLLASDTGGLSRKAELLTLALGLMSTIYGPMLGVFLLGVFTSRRGDVSTSLSLALALLFSAYMQFYLSDYIAWTWRVVFGTGASFILCFLLSRGVGKGGFPRNA